MDYKRVKIYINDEYFDIESHSLDVQGGKCIFDYGKASFYI